MWNSFENRRYFWSKYSRPKVIDFALPAQLVNSNQPHNGKSHAWHTYKHHSARFLLPFESYIAYGIDIWPIFRYSILRCARSCKASDIQKIDRHRQSGFWVTRSDAVTQASRTHTVTQAHLRTCTKSVRVHSLRIYEPIFHFPASISSEVMWHRRYVHNTRRNHSARVVVDEHLVYGFFNLSRRRRDVGANECARRSKHWKTRWRKR